MGFRRIESCCLCLVIYVVSVFVAFSIIMWYRYLLLNSTVISVYGCPCDWLLIDNKCFHVSLDPYTWSDARGYCQSRGSDLIVIKTSKKNDVLKQFLPAFKPSTSLWIGAQDVLTEGDWKWIGAGYVDAFSGKRTLTVLL